MQIVWLGQGGLMLVSQRHKLLIDPYLTNTLKKLDKRMKRRVSIKKKYFKLKPDIILLTNSHPANTDEKTLIKFIKKRRKKKNRLTVLSCESSFGSIFSNKEYKRANHIMFGEGDEWTIENMNIRAVKARTNDRSAFGVLVTDLADGKKYYIAANTLYNEEIISSLPTDIFAAFIPISGTYGCMNRLDAQRFASRINAKFVVPINYGMFDKINPQDFNCNGRIIPKPFKVISFYIDSINTTQNVFDRKFNEKLTPEQVDAIFKARQERKNRKKKPPIATPKEVVDETLSIAEAEEASTEATVSIEPDDVEKVPTEATVSIEPDDVEKVPTEATVSTEPDDVEKVPTEAEATIVLADPVVDEATIILADPVESEANATSEASSQNKTEKRKRNTVILSGDTPTIIKQ